MKLFIKYALLLTALLLLAAGSITTMALAHHQKALTREALLRGESIAVNLALVSSEAILTRNVLQLVGLSMDATTRHENVVYAAVVDKKGNVMAHPDREAVNKPFRFNSRKEERGFSVQARVLDGELGGRALWDVSVPVKPKGSTVELGRVHVGLDQATVRDSVWSSLTRLLLVSVAAIVLGLGAAFLAVRVMVRPIQNLSRASAAVGGGDLNVKVAPGGNDELGELTFNFNQMVENLREAEARKAKAQRLEGELELAHRIQKDLLPTKAPSIPSVEMAFFCEPAKELGGDYYDWFKVDGGKKLGVIVADVSGKGVPAALHMANLRNLFRFTTATLESPLAVARQVNAMAYPDLRGESFVTLVYGVLDPATGRFAYVNCGHDPVQVARADGALEELESTAFPIGFVDAEEFGEGAGEKEIHLGPGDLVFLYTDGVTEAEDRARAQFGMERIRGEMGGKSPAQLVETVRMAVSAHRAGRAATDDETMLALRWLGRA